MDNRSYGWVPVRRVILNYVTDDRMTPDEHYVFLCLRWSWSQAKRYLSRSNPMTCGSPNGNRITSTFPT